MICGVSVFLLEDSPSFIWIFELSSWIYAGLKLVLLPSNRMVYGNFYHDPTLDDVPPPELFFDADSEDFLSL